MRSYRRDAARPSSLGRMTIDVERWPDDGTGFIIWERVTRRQFDGVGVSGRRTTGLWEWGLVLDSVGDQLAAAVQAALEASPRVTAVTWTDRECWEVIGPIRGDELVRLVASLVDAEIDGWEQAQLEAGLPTPDPRHRPDHELKPLLRKMAQQIVRELIQLRRHRAPNDAGSAQELIRGDSRAALDSGLEFGNSLGLSWLLVSSPSKRGGTHLDCPVPRPSGDRYSQVSEVKAG